MKIEHKSQEVPFYIESYNIKCVPTSWTYSTEQAALLIFIQIPNFQRKYKISFNVLPKDVMVGMVSSMALW